MTDRLEDLQDRLRGLDEIGQVVGALRAIASGQTTEARAAAGAIRLYAQTVQEALLRALAGASLSGDHGSTAGPGQLLVIGASQGFSGAYPARIASAARAAWRPGQGLLVIGRRSIAMLEQAGLVIGWSDDLPAHPAAVPDLASRITDALLARQSDHPGPVSVLLAGDQTDGNTSPEQIFPPPPPSAQFPLPASPPLTTLSPAALTRGLLSESLFAAVAEALMNGLAAEATARVQAMARAQNNLKTRHQDIARASQQARQEQMTTEMIEIAGARGIPGDG